MSDHRSSETFAVEPGTAFRRFEEDGIRAANAGREAIDVVVVGAGQAGLATSYHLKKRGIGHVVLEAGERIGDNWRRRWDSLRLFTPARFDGLDGMAFPASGRHFPTKDEMADYLESYAERFALPVRTGVRIRELHRDGEGYALVTDEGTIRARQVVIAAASTQKPKRPSWSEELDPDVLQIDARDYRNPAQLKPRSVLIVGAGNSGAEIATDIAATHEVALSGNSPGELPVPYDSWFAAYVFMPFLFRVLFHRVLSTATPMGRKAQPEFISHSHPLVRVRRAHLIDAGVRFLPKMVGASEGRPRFADGTVEAFDNVIWCAGYGPGLDWVKLPVLDDKGRPRQKRGTVEGQPGLHVVGMHFQRSASSIMIHGVSTDARIVAGEVARRLERREVH